MMRRTIPVVALLVVAGHAASADPSALEPALEALTDKSFKAKGAAVETIAQVGGDPARRILSALLEGDLKFAKGSRLVVIVQESPEGDRTIDPISNAAVDMGDARLKKIVINNKMRKQLRTALARLSLEANDAEVRGAAVRSLYGSLSDETVVMLRETLVRERDAGVQNEIRIALALADLEDTDPAVRIGAIEALGGSLNNEVRNRLGEIAAQEAEAAPSEADSEVRSAAAAAIARIDSRRAMYSWVETIFFGLSLGFVLVLAATGLAITFGVMGVINMAHGELIMIGAYATWVVQQLMPNDLEWSLLVAIPAAFLMSGLVGVAIERGVVRFLYGRPLETLLATFGLSLILQQTIRSIFSPLNRAVATPEWMSGQWVVNDALALTNNRIYIIGFSLAVFFLLVGLLRYTTLGLQIRAVAQNRSIARAMGVRGNWVDAATFGLGAGVAGLAGVALSQLTNVGPNLGQSHIVDSFMVVVFGGVGNLWGTLVAGLSLGIANKFLEPFAGAVLAKIFVLVFIVLFIQRRPRGLFPPRGRAAEA